MEFLAKDFVSLPIIVTDWDALCESKSHIRTPTSEITRSHTVSRMATGRNGTRNTPTIQESIDEIWSRISDSAKAKIREAVMEVLRKTDESQSYKFRHDDDARFLD